MDSCVISCCHHNIPYIYIYIYIYIYMVTPMLLMPLLLSSPSHEQQRYWFQLLGRSYNVEEWRKNSSTYIMFFRCSTGQGSKCTNIIHSITKHGVNPAGRGNSNVDVPKQELIYTYGITQWILHSPKRDIDITITSKYRFLVLITS